MKVVMPATLGAMAAVDILPMEFWARMACYLAPVLIGAIQALRRSRGRKRTKHAREASLSARQGARPGQNGN